MNHITEEMLRSSVQAMPDQFDSHDVIRHIMRTWPRLYVHELYSREQLKDPIMATHAEIGRALARLGLLEKTDRLESRNVRGEFDTENQGWKKQSPDCTRTMLRASLSVCSPPGETALIPSAKVPKEEGGGRMPPSGASGGLYVAETAAQEPLGAQQAHQRQQEYQRSHNGLSFARPTSTTGGSNSGTSSGSPSIGSRYDLPPVCFAICAISSGRTEASDSSGPTARTTTASSPLPRSVSPFFAVATSL